MVCLSSRGPNSEALLRYASRLAGRLNRNWYAVYVQTASESPTKIDAETQRVRFLNPSGRIPAAVNSDVFRAPTPNYVENRRGAKAVSTPARAHSAQ